MKKPILIQLAYHMILGVFSIIMLFSCRSEINADRTGIEQTEEPGVEPVLLTTYIMATNFEHYLSSDEDIDEVIRVCKQYGIRKIYLETFRNGFQVNSAMLSHAIDRLRNAGFTLAAAICTTEWGEPGTVLTNFACLTKEGSKKALEDMFTFAADHFDTIMIDEYIWSHCQCEDCQTEKGERTWTDFRCEQMREVLRDHVIAPSMKASPGIHLIYKFPAMYEQFARQGQDIDFMLEDFEEIWTGTEVGPFLASPQNPLRSQGPYRAFFLMRWMNEMGGEQMGGSWIMPLADEGHSLDAAYQTILGAPRELILHPYGGIAPEYLWALPGGEGQFPEIMRDVEEINQLARIVNENPVRGLVAARPNRAEPWDHGKAYDANVFDYIGQTGVPLRPVRDFPGDAEGYFLSLHTRSFPDYNKKIEFLRSSSLPILITDGLASTLDKNFLDKPNVFVIQASVPYPSVFDYRGFTDPYDMANRLSPVTAEEAWETLEKDIGWDISMKYLGDVRMASRIFGMQLSFPDFMKQRMQEAGLTRNRKVPPLDELQAEMLKPFGITYHGPMHVSVHPYGKDYVVLHNFNGYPVNVWLEPHDKSEIEPVVTLPSTSRVSHIQSGSGFLIEMDQHTLVCYKL